MANVSYMLNDGKLYEIYLSERTVAPGRIAALVKEQAQEALLLPSHISSRLFPLSSKISRHSK